MTSQEIVQRFNEDFIAFADGLRDIAPEYGIQKWLRNSEYRDEIAGRAARLVSDILNMERLSQQAIAALDRAFEQGPPQ